MDLNHSTELHRGYDDSLQGDEPLLRGSVSSLPVGNFLGQPGQEALAIRPWRHLLPELAGLPLLPIGSNGDGKAPADPKTGKGLAGWTTAAFTPEEVEAAHPGIIAVGFRPGPTPSGLIAFDIDGATGIQHCLAHGCDPLAAQTWQVRRDTNKDRLKVIWRIPEDLLHHLACTISKVITKEPSAVGAGDGENVATYYGAGQIVVLGQHKSSKGSYYWPDGHGPADVAEIPLEWWALALEIADKDPRPKTKNGSSSTARGDWRRVKPCPICGRNEHLICSKHKDGGSILCFHGGTFQPPTLKPAEVITGTDGQQWAFTKTRRHGDIGVFSHFKIDEPRPPAKTKPVLLAPPAAPMSADQPGDGDMAPARIEGPGGEPGTAGEQEQEQEQGQEPAAAKQRKPRQPNKPKKIGHSKAMRCFDRCVEIQAQQQRNSLTRRARLLKAAADLGIGKYINRQEISQRILEVKSQQQGQTYKSLTAADRLAMEIPEVRYLIEDLLPADDASIIGGRPKVGKTRFAVAVSASVLTGREILGFKPVQTAPVILVTDDQADGDTGKMLENLQIWDHPNLLWSRHFRLTENDLDGLLKDVKENPGALVILDSLRSISRALQYGENDPEIGAIIYDLKAAVIEAGGTLLIIHHCNKADGLVGTEALSGHNAIPAAVNTIITIHYCPDGSGKPLKNDPFRRIVVEGRSVKAADLVMSPTAGTGGFHQVSTFEAWQTSVKNAEDQQKQEDRTTPQQKRVLGALEAAEGWMTRKEICEALDVPWEDRGRNGGAMGIDKVLRRLVETHQVASERAGTAVVYCLASHETQISKETIETTSDTKGSGIVRQEGDNRRQWRQPVVATGLPSEPVVATGLPSEPVVATGLPSEPVVATGLPSEPVVATGLPSEPVVATGLPSEPVVATGLPQTPCNDRLSPLSPNGGDNETPVPDRLSPLSPLSPPMEQEGQAEKTAAPTIGSTVSKWSKAEKRHIPSWIVLGIEGGEATVQRASGGGRLTVPLSDLRIQRQAS